MSSEWASLSASLQREDLQEIRNRFRQQETDQLTRDLEMAIQLYEAEIDMWETTIADQSMARSQARAVLQDTKIVSDIVAEEEKATIDRRLACKLGGIKATNELHIPGTAGESLGPKSLARYASFNVPEVDLSECLETLATDECNVERGESSKSTQWKGKGKARARTLEKIACTVCDETKHFFDILEAPCRHNYCRNCTIDLFRLATTDESLFPPRCCRREIPVELAREFLDRDLSIRFVEKAEEFRTPNRTYCVAPSCSKFIPLANIDNDVATCPACLERTCTMCKGRAHGGDCPHDTALQQAIEAANDRNWQRCYSCKRIVELSYGCNHITCLCKAQFCYVCARRWKTCRCDTWTENRLYDRAVQVAAREPRRRRIEMAPVQGTAGHAINAAVVPQIVRPQVISPQVVRPQIVIPQIEAAGPIDEVPAPILSPARPEIPHVGQIEAAGSIDEVPAPIQAPAGPEIPLVGQFEARLEQHEDPEDPDLIGGIMNALRENHVCAHEHWRYIDGPHQCEECFHHLPHYIFECRQCRILACWRCRRNRL